MGAITPDGQLLWQRRWEGFSHFKVSRDRVFIDGHRARRISAHTGETEAERDLGNKASIVWAQDAGPIYRIPSRKHYYGLDGDSLAPLWEFAPDREDFSYGHEGFLCRYREGQGVTMFELPSLAARGPVPTPPMAKHGMHAHVGDIWCQFGSSEGGRAAVDLATGEEVWRFEEPDAHGLMTFDEERGYSPMNALIAYDLRTGQPVWRRDFGEVPTSRARLRDGLLYLATGDKHAHIVEARTGEVCLSPPLDFESSGGIEPSPAVPYGPDRILVGTQYAILCLQRP
jgi:outer membrane protein assembly factor BamB